MTVSLLEITFYFSALSYSNLMAMGSISFNLIHAVQHLYFIVAAPALFISLGIVILDSRVLPRIFAYLALALGPPFAVLGIIFLTSLVLPVAVQAFASVQALWWLAAAITVIIRAARTPDSISVEVRG